MGLAGVIAWRCCAQEVAPIHILWGLVACSAGPHRAALARAGLDSDAAKERLERLLKPSRSGQPEVVPSGQACGVLVCRAIDRATIEGDRQISTMHLLQALIDSRDPQVQAFISPDGE